MIPDRTFTRTGVPSLRLKTPKYGKNAPSYAATAWIRSEPIIHTEPEVIERADEAERHHDQQRVRCAAVDAVEVSVTASMKPPMPVTLLAGQHEEDAEDRDRRT